MIRGLSFSLLATAAVAVLALLIGANHAGAEGKTGTDEKDDKKGSGYNPAEPERDAATAIPRGEITVMPDGFTSFGAAVQDGYLYAIGGHTGAAHEYDREGFNNVFWRLNLRDRTSWEVLPGGVDLQSVALVSDGERLYRIGGMTADNAPGEDHELRSTDGVSAFDPLTRQWTDLPTLPELRSSHDAVVHDGKLYVLGGWKLAKDPLSRETEEENWHDTGLVLDPSSDEPAWTRFAQPFKTRALAVASNGERIYAIGGMTPDGMSNKTRLYDPTEDKWADGPELPGFAFGTSAFGMNGRVYATNWEGKLFSHAPGEKTWREDATLTFGRFFHRLVAVNNNELAAVGGVTRGGKVRNVEWITPGRKGPSISRLTMPNPGNAKARQGVFFFQNNLYVFGGNNSVLDHQFEPDNFVNEAYKINVPSLHAERIAELPVNRQSFKTFMVGTDERFAEKLGYAVGGFGHDGEAAVTHADIFLYSIDADVWEKAKIELPVPLTQFGLTKHDGKVYLFGGLDFDPARGKKGRFQESKKIFVWDPKGKEKKFTALEPELPIARRAFAGATLEGKYYIVGGMTANFEEVDRCHVFDYESGEWSEIPNPSDARLSPTLIPLNGKLYLVGGSSPTLDGFVRNTSIECFDPETGKWSMVIEDLGENLGELQAFAYGDGLLLYSAHNDADEIRFVFVKP